MPPNSSERKRKRDSEKPEGPSKKHALEQDMPPLAIRILEDDSELAPVLVTMPGMRLPQGLSLHPYLKPRGHTEAKVSVDRNRGILSSELLLQSSEHEKLDFLGREMIGDVDSQLKHYVAVADPDQGTWTFVEARKMVLRGSVRRLQPSQNGGSGENGQGDEALKSMRAQRSALTYAFGTKKSRKAAQSVAENASLSNAPLGAANAAESAILSSMPAEAIAAATTKTATLQAEIRAAKPVPPANLSATHPSDVYSLDILVPNGLTTLGQLPVKGWRDAVMTDQAIATTSRYVAHRVEATVKSNNTTQLQILRFILVLLEFARCLRKSKPGDSKSGGAGSRRLPPREELRRILSGLPPRLGSTNSAFASHALLPEPVIDAVRRKFSPQGSHLSKTDITLLHTTICALSLHIPPTPGGDDGSRSRTDRAPSELATDLADLRDDLHLDNPAITQYFRELGCRIDKPRESEYATWGIKGGKAEAAARKIARLRVPPEFPKVSRGGGSRR